MMEEQQFHLPQNQPHQGAKEGSYETAPLSADSNGLQNPSAEDEKQDSLGLGFTDKTATFGTDHTVENPSADEKGDSDYYDDDGAAERIINEELRNLVLEQAIGEKRGVMGFEEDGENAEMENWGGFKEEGEQEGYEENGSESGNGDVNQNVGKEGKYSVRKFSYPVRPDAEDCAYYMKTGSCKFGFHCKFNHPPVPRRKFQGTKDKVKQREENLESAGQTECKYYLTPGGCKYGTACKYNHSRAQGSLVPILEFNFLGLPIRVGEKECPYYMRNGSCKYGSNCRFHHPDPTTVAGADPSSGYGNGGSLPFASQSSVSSWSSPRALNDSAPFSPMMFPPTKGVPSPEWNGYQAPVYPTSERSLPSPPAFAMNNLGTDTNFHSTSHQQQMLVEEFPERPGQLECTYFLKTGDCKYKSNCKFDHPKGRITMSRSCALNDKGLPLRPDKAVCSFYNRYGICKFGPACKFDHPDELAYAGPDDVANFDQSSMGNPLTSDGTRMASKDNGDGSLIQQHV